DIISNNYSLSNVSLIIFDECHRAVGNYAYTFIAQKYMSLDGSRQILGITASPGATEEKINIIKENLFIDKIEIRTEKDEDVKPYIQKVDIIWIKIDLPEDFLEILKILEKKLKEIYKFLKHQNFIDSEVIRNISRLKILGLNKEIDLKISQTTDDNEKFAMFNAKKMVANALRLSHMIELLETQGLKALEQYFTKNEENIQNNKSSKSLNELFQNRDFKKAINLTRKLISEGLIHPKMKKLKESLSEQISLNENSRILVFSQYRDSVNNIINYFGKDDVIQIHKFIGQQTKGRDKGMSQKNQLEILDKFKEGIYNVLVSTNVGEEGLDIPDCDLVIFYDMT
ncbi:MAG: DEAD/DEAH box helicase, partial [Candidatus Lokiarchaeota archaeon]|nr:DEAD/DEAH box helicase [Candidatus Lokiarchaeota archaeon]